MSEIVKRVIKRDGRIVKFDPTKIIEAVIRTMKSVDVENDELAKAVTNEVIKKINGQEEISVEIIQDYVENELIKRADPIVSKAFILYRSKRTEVREVKEQLGIDDDLKFGVNALALLDKRYLKKVNDKKETPSQMFHRVANAVAAVERSYGDSPAKWAKIYYNLMSNQIFMPNTPCLANAGNPNLNYLAACYAFEVGDSIEEIFQTAKDAAIVQKTGGGIGLNLSKLRPSGDAVKSTEGISSGPVEFMKIFDATSDVIKQGGIRRGGNLGLMLINHPNIVDYIKCKNTEGTFANFNISVALTDKFMDAVKKDTDFDLVNPRNNRVASTVKARSLFDLIVDSAWKNGEPGIVFWDKTERDNPTPKLGHVIKNLCSEVDLIPYECCILGGINLSKFVDDGKIIYSSLSKVVYHAVRFLDDVIDATNYPLPQIENAAKGNRKIGLGLMGFANMLFLLGIPYDSEEALQLASDIVKFVSAASRKASEELAFLRGDFPNIQESIYAGKHIRNASRIVLAPNGSTGIIAETSSGIEPAFGIVFRRENILEGRTFDEVNSAFEKIAKREGWYSQELIDKIVKNNGSVKGLSEVPEKWQKVFTTALEITPEYHLKMQAAFQKYVDNSISKTINLPFDTTKKQVAKIILDAFDLDVKGLTVYRNQSREKQVMRVNTNCVECESGACPLPVKKE